MSTTQGTFTVRWGKLSLALLGLLALVAVPVTLVLALLTSVSLWAPLLSLCVVALAFAGLRASAVQDRRRKAWQEAAVAVPAALVESAAKDAADRATAEAAAAERAAQLEAEQAKARQEELLAAARERNDAPFDLSASDAQDEVVGNDETPAEQDAPAAPEEDTTWEPRTLPAPSYVGAQPVQRAAAAPLPREESKRAEVITSIRQAEAQRLEEERAQAAERLNLDAVLQRRRA